LLETCTLLQVFLGGLLIGGADETLAALGDGSFQAALEGGGVGGALPAHLRDEVDRALQHTPKVWLSKRRTGGFSAVLISASLITT